MKRFQIAVLASSILLVPSLVSAATPPMTTTTTTTATTPVATTPATGNPAVAVNVSAADFLAQVGNIMLTRSCDPSSPLLTHFKITSADCQTKVTAAEATCTKQVLPQMPANVSTPADAAKWGQNYGTCIGLTFAKEMGINVTTNGTNNAAQ